MQTLEINKKLFYTKINLNNQKTNRNDNSRQVEFLDVTDEEEEIDPLERSIIDLKNLNKKPQKSNAQKYPIQYESLIFRSEVYKTLSSMKFDISSNLSEKQIYFLKKCLKGRANFMVLQCDKNIGSIIISKTDYEKLILKYLDENKDNYQALSENPLEKTIKVINDKLSSLYKRKAISLELYNCLKLNNLCKLGMIRLLPKLHKDKFGVRAIINCINHPTEKLCKLVDSFLKPIVVGLPTVLKDSQDLLQRFEKFKPRNINKMFLYSCDFESLYTNIKPEDATNKICHFLKTNKLLESSHVKLSAFKVILSLIFKWNIFKYKTLFFKQTIGLPMGCKCGPTIAILYLYIIEKEWISKNEPLLYGRFIDDICLCDNRELDCKKFQEHFKYLKLNIVHSEEIAFLDLSISFDYLTNRIRTNLYTKPTNTYSHLLYNSNHPGHIFRNIPKSLFIRIRRICSSYIDYVAQSKKLIIQLYRRGYDLVEVSNTARAIGNLDRTSLLPYKNKNNNNIKNKNLINHYKFDNSLSFLKKSFSEAFYYTKKILIKENSNKKYDYIQDFEIKTLFSIGNSIGSSLIHGFKGKNLIPTDSNRRCMSFGCKTCPYLKEDNKIKLNNIIIPFSKQSNCRSTGVIYIISCTKCNCHYIGESERTANERFSEHLYKIMFFRNNLGRSLSKFDEMPEVAIHFNKRGHSLKDLSFNIVNNNLKNVVERKSLESDLIHLFDFMKIKTLNRKKPKYKYIKHLTFI
jgi:hypothetical protein